MVILVLPNPLDTNKSEISCFSEFVHEHLFGNLAASALARRNRSGFRVFWCGFRCLGQFLIGGRRMIEFTKPSGEFGFLSPYHTQPFTGYRAVRNNQFKLARKPDLYPTIEHFYQSEKFRGISVEDEILRCATFWQPGVGEARKVALSYRDKMRPDWDDVKIHVLVSAILFKFTQHKDLGELLISTGDEEFAYISQADAELGIGRNGNGANLYGTALALARAKLAASEQMKVIVTGSHEFGGYPYLDTKLRSLFQRKMPDVIISSGKPGAESMAELWAMQNHIPVMHFTRKGKVEQPFDMLSHGTHMVVFSSATAAEVEQLCAPAKQRGLVIRLVKIPS